jgi:GNAT superfamily N-acetyltransferase
MADPTPLEQIDRYRDRFPGPHLALVLDSIAAGNTAAELWLIPQPQAAPIALLWDQGNNVFYLAGECQTQASSHHLADLVATRIRPQAQAQGATYFKTQALSASLEPMLPQIFAGVTLHEYPTYFYSDAAGPAVAAQPTQPELTITPISRELLAREDLANREHVRAEIKWMWPAEERFYAQGFGVLAIARDEIVCWCTAEYVGPTHCGIGIATLPAYERRGIATATAARFLGEARQRGLTTCWECGRMNLGSVRVAEKLGFVRQAEERYWVGSFES